NAHLVEIPMRWIRLALITSGLAIASLAAAADAQQPLRGEARIARFADPAFDRFVDLKLFGRAIADADPAGLADAALQLAGGERWGRTRVCPPGRHCGGRSGGLPPRATRRRWSGLVSTPRRPTTGPWPRPSSCLAKPAARTTTRRCRRTATSSCPTTWW